MMMMIDHRNHFQNKTGDLAFSVGDLEVIGSQSLQQVWLADHSIDIDIHDNLCEFLVFQLSRSIHIESIVKCFHFMLFEVAPKLIHSVFETIIVAHSRIAQVEERKRLFGSLPLVGLAIALLTDFLIQHQLELF